MPIETTYRAIILKKQLYGEGDEIISVFTREAGKVRVIAKSLKSSKSRLQAFLQALFYVELIVSGRGSLPTVTSVQVQNPFLHIRDNFTAAKISMYVQELVLRFTPDEQANPGLFDLLVEFLSFTDEHAGAEAVLYAGLAKFKIMFLEQLGLGILYDLDLLDVPRIGFNNDKGGFVEGDFVGSQPVDKQVLRQFVMLAEQQFSSISGQNLPGDISALQNILSQFLSYQLERDIRSELYLNL